MTQRKSVQNGALPRLHTPEEVATALGCSDWWVKEQARRRRIPFTRAGGAYRFTADHFAEIVSLFEERPAERAEAQIRRSVSGPVRRRKRQRPTSASQQLQPRPPRRRLALDAA